MSKNFEKIKSYYKSGKWDKQRVWNCVGKALGITAEEYERIVREPYVPINE